MRGASPLAERVVLEGTGIALGVARLDHLPERVGDLRRLTGIGIGDRDRETVVGGRRGLRAVGGRKSHHAVEGIVGTGAPDERVAGEVGFGRPVGAPPTVVLGIDLHEAAIEALRPLAHLAAQQVAEDARRRGAGGIGLHIRSGAAVRAAGVAVELEHGVGTVRAVLLRDTPETVEYPTGSEPVGIRGAGLHSEARVEAHTAHVTQRIRQRGREPAVGRIGRRGAAGRDAGTRHRLGQAVAERIEGVGARELVGRALARLARDADQRARACGVRERGAEVIGRARDAVPVMRHQPLIQLADTPVGGIVGERVGGDRLPRRAGLRIVQQDRLRHQIAVRIALGALGARGEQAPVEQIVAIADGLVEVREHGAGGRAGVLVVLPRRARQQAVRAGLARLVRVGEPDERKGLPVGRNRGGVLVLVDRRDRRKAQIAAPAYLAREARVAVLRNELPADAVAAGDLLHDVAIVLHVLQREHRAAALRVDGAVGQRRVADRHRLSETVRDRAEQVQRPVVAHVVPHGARFIVVVRVLALSVGRYAVVHLPVAIEVDHLAEQGAVGLPAVDLYVGVASCTVGEVR